MPDVQLPDGSIGRFPEGMSDDAIAAVLRKQFPPSNPRLVAGLDASVDQALAGARERSNPATQRWHSPMDESGGAEMTGGQALAVGGMLGGEAFAGSAAIPGAVGAIGRAFVANPKTSGPGTGGLPGVIR